MLTLSDWITACAVIFPVLALADWLFRPMLARRFDWWKLEPGDDNPSLLWLGAGLFAAIAGCFLFIGAAIGL